MPRLPSNCARDHAALGAQERRRADRRPRAHQAALEQRRRARRARQTPAVGERRQLGGARTSRRRSGTAARRRELEGAGRQVGVEAAGDGRAPGASQSVVVARPQVGAGRGLLVGVGAARRREGPPPPRPQRREPELARDGEAGLGLQLDDLEPGRRRLQAGAAAERLVRLESEHQPDARGRECRARSGAPTHSRKPTRISRLIRNGFPTAARLGRRACRPRARASRPGRPGATSPPCPSP